jgi:hypothetical protein
MLRSYRDLTRFEFFLWLGSAAAVIGSFAVSWMISPEEGRDYLTLIGSLIGVTALIYVSKGYPLGQMLVVLWILATLTQVSYLPMAVCFLMFFVNDLYGSTTGEG